MSVATPPRPASSRVGYGYNGGTETEEGALCDEGEQASKPSFACPVTASDAAEDSSQVGGSPGKKLDRRGMVTCGGGQLFARLLHTA